MRYSRYIRAWPLIPVALVVIWLGREDEAEGTSPSEGEVEIVDSQRR